MPPKRIIFASACALLAVITAACLYMMRAGAYRKGAMAGADTEWGAARVNRPLPDFRPKGLGHSEVDVGELRKGRVLLVYLTTDCSHCIKEAEIISGLRRDAPPGLKIYGVAIERAPAVEAFARKANLTFPVLLDEGARLAQSLEIHHFPSKFLVQDGVITRYWRGTTRDSNELLRQLGAE